MPSPTPSLKVCPSTSIIKLTTYFFSYFPLNTNQTIFAENEVDRCGWWRLAPVERCLSHQAVNIPFHFDYFIDRCFYNKQKLWVFNFWFLILESVDGKFFFPPLFTYTVILLIYQLVSYIADFKTIPLMRKQSP